MSRSEERPNEMSVIMRCMMNRGMGDKEIRKKVGERWQITNENNKIFLTIIDRRTRVRVAKLERCGVG